MKNHYRTIGDAIAIFVFHKGKRLSALIDKDDLAIAKSIDNSWCASRDHRTGCFYVSARVKGSHGKHVRLHRLIMETVDGQEVDHRDHDGLNNRRCNLKNVTPSGNRCNPRKSRCKWGFLNIKFDARPARRKRPWEAHSKVTGKLTHLGYFETARDAAVAVMNHNHANGFAYIHEKELGYCPSVSITQPSVLAPACSPLSAILS